MSDSEEGTIKSDIEVENTKKVGKRKSSRSQSTETIEGDSIKTRLRKNSGTPKKPSKKDVTTGGNAKQLRKMYEVEGRSMQSFLNKQLVSNSDSEIVFNDVRGDGVTNPKTNSGATHRLEKQTLSVNAEEGANASSNSYSDINSGLDMGITEHNKTPRSQQEVVMHHQNKEAELEIQMLETKLRKMEDRSMEKMFLELRLDMKKDNLKMMSKIDGVSLVAGGLTVDIQRLQMSQSQMETRIKSTQDRQVEDKVRVNQISLEMVKLADQVRILQGLLQTQDQELFLRRKEKEDKLARKF